MRAQEVWNPLLDRIRRESVGPGAAHVSVHSNTYGKGALLDYSSSKIAVISAQIPNKFSF